MTAPRKEFIFINSLLIRFNDGQSWQFILFNLEKGLVFIFVNLKLLTPSWEGRCVYSEIFGKDENEGDKEGCAKSGELVLCVVKS
jgi:hypothetical protein